MATANGIQSKPGPGCGWVVMWGVRLSLADPHRRLPHCAGQRTPLRMSATPEQVTTAMQAGAMSCTSP